MPPHPGPETRRLLLLGSTGSIGTQTIEVVRNLNKLHAQGRWPHRFQIVGLAAGRNAHALAAQAAEFNVRDLAIAEPSGSPLPSNARVRTGPDAAERLVREVDADIVLAAMVGSAGLPATLAAVELGRDVALANKETLVAAGALVIPAAQRSGACLFPVDSEHCAVWQCLQGAPTPSLREGAGGRADSPSLREGAGGRADSPSLREGAGGRADSPSLREGAGGRVPGVPSAQCPPMTCTDEITRVILTASGGPFRTKSRQETYHARPEDALRHPTWNMGPKVTIDCASLTNKALEVIEAHWLFGLPARKIEVLVHPQSVVHAIVEYADGSAVAQLAPPDMRTPIQYALTYPHRPEGVSRRLSWLDLPNLEFTPPDLARFPALKLAYTVIEAGGTAGAIFNAANEAAVEAFLAGKIPFGRIPELTQSALEAISTTPLADLATVQQADAQARAFVRSQV